MKRIKIIDLLNMISRKEEVPRKIKFEDKIYTYYNEITDYKNEDYFFLDMISDGYVKDFLNDKVEIIEEQEEIDIPNIVMMDLEKYGFDNKDEFAIDLIFKVNELVQAVKQLDKIIKEK